MFCAFIAGRNDANKKPDQYLELHIFNNHCEQPEISTETREKSDNDRYSIVEDTIIVAHGDPSSTPVMRIFSMINPKKAEVVKVIVPNKITSPTFG